MAYCSVEEAWGSPLSPTPSMLQDNECELNQKTHPVFTENFDVSAKETQSHSTVAPPKSDQFEGSITDPPLRGSLLSGAIPDETWKYKEKKQEVSAENNKNIEFKTNDILTEKLDQMIQILQKKNCTSWTDVLIFVVLGIFSIVLLDMFFRLGKFMILKGSSTMSQPTQPPQYQYYLPQNQIPGPAPIQQIPINTNNINTSNVPPNMPRYY